MFTNNYMALQRNMFAGEHPTMKNMLGENFALYSTFNFDGSDNIGNLMANANCRAMTDTVSSSSGGVSTGVWFGSGSTPATKGDYKLESPITSGLSITTQTKLIGKESEGKYCAWVSYVVKNTSDNDINIWELGVFAEAKRDSTKFHSVLLDRVVLPEPIVLAVGEEKIITYKITFNQILNVE